MKKGEDMILAFFLEFALKILEKTIPSFAPLVVTPVFSKIEFFNLLCFHSILTNTSRIYIRCDTRNISGRSTNTIIHR
ncbi:hypothetical protein D3C72_1922830 [compost metagenome]